MAFSFFEKISEKLPNDEYALFLTSQNNYDIRSTMDRWHAANAHIGIFRRHISKSTK